jgi:Zn-dependent metalloprotease
MGTDMQQRPDLPLRFALSISVALLLLACLAPQAYGMPGNRASAAANGSIGPGLSSVGTTTPGDPDERLQQLANRLREAVAKQRFRRQQLHVSAPTSSVSPVIQSLRNRLGAQLKLLGLQETGVHRQIRGGMLEPAAKTAGKEIDRDRETARHFLGKRKDVLRLDDPARELKLARYSRDELGRRHLHYTQTHRGLPIWPAEVIVHTDPAGNIDAVDGGHIPTPRKAATKPILSESEATAKARDAANASRMAPARPPQLIYYADDPGQSWLAWRVELPISIREHWVVVVDAVSGAILHTHNRVTDANVAGSGIDLMGNTDGLDVWQSGDSFFLVDTSKPMFDATSIPPTNSKGAIVVQDARNKPTGPNPESQPDPQLFQITASSANGPWLTDGVSAAFNLSETYDYYLERHNRDSIDGHQGGLNAIVRYGQTYPNAFWSNPYMVFGNADRYAAALDVVAHELAHGVTEHTANLIYAGQSGALNEALSDIFGESVERRTTGHNDWLMGTDLKRPIRNLKNPAQFGDPAKMSQYQALPNSPAGDWGGVHINSCIIGHAYYLLVEGMTGAIGMADAEKIFYRALTEHLVANAQFADMRRAAVISAEELFGQGSAQATATGQAFDAVELTDSGSTPPPTPIPTIEGEDSTLSVSFDPAPPAGIYLRRRETALDDPPQGSILSATPANFQRPAVSGDGATAVYVDAFNDVCLIDTATPGSESCLNLIGQISSVAISPDGTRFAFVLLDSQGKPQNFISVIDIASQGAPKRYTLKAPATDAAPPTIDYADAMDFSVDGRQIIYDAFNEFPSAGATPLTSWSIYALDLLNEQFLSIVPPSTGLNIGNPSVGRAASGHLTYEKLDPVSQSSTVWAADLNTATHNLIRTVDGPFALATPHFTGDDKAIVFSQPDATTDTGYSLWQVALSDDRQSAAGEPTPWMTNAAFGVVYRRGIYTPIPQFTLSTTASVGGKIVSTPGGISCGTTCEAEFPQDTLVTLTAVHAPGWAFQQWTGCDSVAGTTCNVHMTAHKNLQASFAVSPMTVNVGVDGGGLVTSAAGIRCRNTNAPTCSKTFTRPRKVKLVARPDTDSVLDRWDGCETIAGKTCLVTVDSLQNVHAYFREKRQLTLTVSASGNGSGTILSIPKGINCGGTCQQTILEGRKVQLIARRQSGSVFAGWTNCPKPRGNRCHVTMNSDESIGVIFEPKP